MVFKWLRTRLAARAAAAILFLMVVVSLASLSVSVRSVWTGESARQHQQLLDLLDTVANTAQIAAFLTDSELAREVVDGLAGNSIVHSAFLYADGVLLAESGRQRAGPACAVGEAGKQRILRPIHSPFDDSVVVGELLLCPNHDEIRTVVRRSTLFAGAMLLLQALLLGAGVAGIVVWLVTRPVTTLSHRLHSLDLEAGDKLLLPAANTHDEIGQLVRDVNGMIDRLVRTIARERQLRQERELGERRLQAIFDNAATAIFLFDREGRLMSFNPEFVRCFRLDPATASAGRAMNLYELLGAEASLLRALVEDSVQMSTAASTELRIRDGSEVAWLQISLSSVGLDTFQGVANDITNRKLAQMAAETRAVTDPLTQLGNRAGFELGLTALMNRQHETGAGFALLMLDLDRFKEVNDTYGHPAGDEVLQRVAQLLRKVSRKTDYVARLGGDEFVLLLPDADRDAATRVAREVVALVAQPMMVADGIAVAVSASVGVALSERHQEERRLQEERRPQEESRLIERADEALYRAKRQGRNQYHVAP